MSDRGPQLKIAGGAADETADAAARDASSLDAAGWPLRPLEELESGHRSSGFQVVARSDALDAIRIHGRSRTTIEVAGVLVGNLYRDEHGPYVYVQAAISAEGSRGDATHVTFTSEAWQRIHEEIDKKFPDDRIVGWYHTHPDFGIFLSEMDFFIQRNFFDMPWQVAFVYDPVRNEEGMFVWRKGGPVVEPILIERAPGAAAPESPSARPKAVDDAWTDKGSTPDLESDETSDAGTKFWLVFLIGVGVLLGSLTIAEWLGITR